MQHDATVRRPVTRGRLWFGLLGSAVAWFIHLVAVYTLAEAACVTGFPWFAVGGVHGASLLIVAVTLLLLALAVASGYVAYWNGRQLDREHDGRYASTDRGVGRHMARGGVYLAVTFVFIIASETLPVFFMHPCP